MGFIGRYGFYRQLWVFTGDYGFILPIMGFHWPLWVFIVDHGILLMIMGILRQLWASNGVSVF